MRNTPKQLLQILTNIRKLIAFKEETIDQHDYQICLGRLIWEDVRPNLKNPELDEAGQLKRDESIDGDDFKVIKKSTNELICQGSCAKMLQLSFSQDFEGVSDYLDIR